MSSRPLKIPGHRPLSRPEERDRPFAVGAGAGSGGGSGGSVPRRSLPDPRVGQLARCLSRGRRPGTAVAPVRAITDAVASREAALRRLRRVSDSHAEARQVYTEVRRELVDALLHVRVLSLEAVEAIEAWRASSRGTGIWRDQATGENYLLKMKDDTRWLGESPLGEILYFSPKSDPFFVIPSTHDCPSAPTNQMTPTLQARRQTQPGDSHRKATLPLQASQLRRIRKAELVILREAMQARMQQGAGMSLATTASEASDSATPSSTLRLRDTGGGAPAAAEKPAPAARDDFSKVQAHLLTASLGVLEEVLDPTSREAPASARQQLAGSGTLRPPSAGAAVPAGPPRPRPPAPAEPSGPFCLRPVEATTASIRGVWEQYLPRAEPRLVAALEPWKALEAALEEEGSAAPEWFWLFRAGQAGAEPDGLAVFRLKRMSTTFGQLLHISVVDISMLEDALSSVKAWMFTYLPIRSIRVTLWYAERDGELQLDKDLEGYFKRCRFRWFQLTNQSGARGSVMNGPRFAPPDCEDGPDPVMPVELPGIEFCLGQAWLRGAQQPPAGKTRAGACARSLVLAAACLRYFWGRDAGEADRAADAANAPAREAAREGLVRGLLSGDLENLLARCKPASLQQADGPLGQGGATDASAVLALRLARSLEASGTAVPGILCEGSDAAEELVRRGSTAPGFADAADGLGLEELPEAVAALRAQDAAFGRLFVCLDWHAMTVVDGDTFEVPVHAAGLCPRHPHPVFYVATSEDDTFVVIIPWADASRPPSQDAAFAACTEILRATEPVETPPFGALRLPSFDARRAVETTEIADAGTLGMPGTTALHIAEFASLSVTPGRGMPGRLGQPGAGRKVFPIRKPFAITLWHTDIDELNVPLAATLVA